MEDSRIPQALPLARALKYGAAEVYLMLTKSMWWMRSLVCVMAFSGALGETDGGGGCGAPVESCSDLCHDATDVNQCMMQCEVRRSGP